MPLEGAEPWSGGKARRIGAFRARLCCRLVQVHPVCAEHLQVGMPRGRLNACPPSVGRCSVGSDCQDMFAYILLMHLVRCLQLRFDIGSSLYLDVACSDSPFAREL